MIVDCWLVTVKNIRDQKKNRRKHKKRKENTMMRKKGRTNEACRDVCELSIEEKSAKSSSVSESILSLVHSLPIHGTTRSTRGRKPCYNNTTNIVNPSPRPWEALPTSQKVGSQIVHEPFQLYTVMPTLVLLLPSAPSL